MAGLLRGGNTVGPQKAGTGADHLRQTLNTAFADAIPPVRTPLLYQFGLLIVALAMLLLPLLYVALIGFVGYGVWFHATHNVTILHTWSGVFFRLVAYGGPLIAGGIAVVFMVKPLFAPRVKDPDPYSLRREDQPLLFQCVESLCDALGAPRPARIDVDLQVNASASFRRGAMSLFGRDLVLTIGLPLVSDLDTRQFVGVLAHEFGHFTQGVAMRLGYLINSVNSWFARVVYQRDAWDEGLEQAAAAGQVWFVAVILWLSALAVWLTRFILTGLMWIGHGISCFLSRQMEYNADAYQVRVAGSEIVGAIHVRLTVLGMAMTRAQEELSDSWRERRLGDNLPALVANNARELSAQPQIMAQVRKSVFDAKTRPFDTHPSAKDRVARANRSRQSGVLQSNRPAHRLLADYDNLCRSVSLMFYRQAVDETITETNLTPVEALLREQKAHEESLASLNRYVAGLPLDRPGVFPSFPDPDELPDRSTIMVTLQDARDHLQSGMPDLRRAVGEFLSADQRWQQARLGQRLRSAGSVFRVAARKLAGEQNVEDGLDAAVRERESRYADIEDCVEAARQRLDSALALAAHQQGQDGWPDSWVRLGAAVAAIEKAWPALDALRETGAGFEFMLAAIAGHTVDETTSSHLSQLQRNLLSSLQAIAHLLEETEYPYSHTAGSLSIAQYAMPSVPDMPDTVILPVALQAVDNIYALYRRVLSDLAVIAERAEVQAGLKQLCLD